MSYDFEPESSRAPSPPVDAPVATLATWGPRHLLIGIVGILILFSIVVTAVVGPVLAFYESDSPQAYFASSAGQALWYVTGVFLLYAIIQRCGADWINLGLRPFSFDPQSIFGRVVRSLPVVPRWLIVPILGYVLCYGCVLLYGIVVSLTGADFLEPDQQIPSRAFDSPFVVAMMGLAIVVGAPIAEEIMFRGFLFAGLRRRLPLLPAVLVSGFVFSMAHVNVGLIIPFTLVGMVLAYTYEKTGSLYGAMSVHFVFNLVSFVALLLIPEARDR